MSVYATPEPAVVRPVFTCAASACEMSKEKGGSGKIG